jgi:hypothetical protein
VRDEGVALRNDLNYLDVMLSAAGEVGVAH